MKKVLLMMVAFMATMTAFAQEEPEGWEKSFAPVTSEDKLAGVHTAVIFDGSVYASSTIDQQLQFGSSTIEPEGGLQSSCVVKYDKEGKELWAVLLYGSSTITAMTTDADGNVYVAGTFMDTALDLIGTDGDENKKTVEGNSAAYSAFVAKIDADGKAIALKAFTSETNEWIASLMIPDPWDWESLNPPLVPAYSPYDPIEVTPQCIKVDGEKVYVGVMYSGNITELGWDGRYWTDDFFGNIYDALSAGVFSLNKNDLTSPTSLCNVGNTKKGNSAESVTYDLYEPDDINFVVKDGNVFFGFFGHGDLTLTTATESMPFSFDKATSYDFDDERALVLSNLADVQNKTLQFRAPSLVSLFYSARFRLADAELIGNNVYLAGTFAGQFALDNTKYSVSDTKSHSSSFVAAIKMSDGSAKWTWVDEAESEATCMIVTGEEIKASTDAVTYTFKTETGEVKTDMTLNYGFADADVYNDEYVSTVRADGASVVVFSPKMSPSGIEAIKAAVANGETKIFNLNGQRVAAPQKGLYIMDGKKVVIK